MLGSLLAGTEEAPGDTETYQGRRYKVYRGMGSLGCHEAGSSDRYFQERESKLVQKALRAECLTRGQYRRQSSSWWVVQGLEPDIVGARNIEELKTKTKFVRITSAGLRESHPHNVQLTKEAPNYYL